VRVDNDPTHLASVHRSFAEGSRR